MAQPLLHLTAQTDSDRLSYVRIGNGVRVTMDTIAPAVTAPVIAGLEADAVERCRVQELDHIRAACRRLSADLLTRMPAATDRPHPQVRVPASAVNVEERAWELAPDRFTVAGHHHRLAVTATVPDGVSDAALVRAMVEQVITVRTAGLREVYEKILNGVLSDESTATAGH